MAIWNQDVADLWTRRFTAWGSMVVTVFIFGLLAFALITTSGIADKQAFNGLNETIKAMAMIAVGFWMGSSNSGQKKDDTIAAQAAAASAPATTTMTVSPGPPASATATTSPAQAAEAGAHPDEPTRPGG